MISISFSGDEMRLGNVATKGTWSPSREWDYPRQSNHWNLHETGRAVSLRRHP